MLSAASPADHTEISQKINGQMQELEVPLKDLATRGVNAVALDSMRSAVGHLRINIKSLDKLIEDRMVVNEVKRRRLEDAIATHNDIQGLLTPWLQIVDDEIAQPYLSDGRLVRVLSDWCPPFSGCHLYYPSRRQPSPAFSLLVEALRHRGKTDA